MHDFDDAEVDTKRVIVILQKPPLRSTTMSQSFYNSYILQSSPVIRGFSGYKYPLTINWAKPRIMKEYSSKHALKGSTMVILLSAGCTFSLMQPLRIP